MFITALAITGCIKNEPRVNHAQLEQDKKELYALNISYTQGKIDAYVYIKQARILNVKIYNQEKNLDTHDHMH